MGLGKEIMDNELELSHLKLKWDVVRSVATAALASKNTPAGHRVYLRCMSILETELGIDNDKNAEVAEGYLSSLSELFPQQPEVIEKKELFRED